MATWMLSVTLMIDRVRVVICSGTRLPVVLSASSAPAGPTRASRASSGQWRGRGGRWIIVGAWAVGEDLPYNLGSGMATPGGWLRNRAAPAYGAGTPP